MVSKWRQEFGCLWAEREGRVGEEMDRKGKGRLHSALPWGLEERSADGLERQLASLGNRKTQATPWCTRVPTAKPELGRRGLAGFRICRPPSKVKASQGPNREMPTKTKCTYRYAYACLLRHMLVILNIINTDSSV